MGSDLLAKFLLHYDPIHDGFTPSGIANGVSLTNGFSFPRIRGGYNLYRGGPAREDIDWSVPVGAAPADAATIANFPWRGHTPGTVYFYGLRAIGGGGVECADVGSVQRVEFDAAGALIGPRPNAPTNLQVRPVAGGKFALRWTYSPCGEQTAPAEFRIYHDGGTGAVQYDAPVGVVGYRSGRFAYSYVSDAFADQTKVQWVVRAASSEGVEEDNTAVVFARRRCGRSPDRRRRALLRWEAGIAIRRGWTT